MNQCVPIKTTLPTKEIPPETMKKVMDTDPEHLRVLVTDIPPRRRRQ